MVCGSQDTGKAQGVGRMRYPPGHKRKAREALLDASARSLKEAGFNGIGVDGLAAAAGVTSGAFYSNFPTKEAMLEAVVETGVGEPFLSQTETGTTAEKRARLMTLLDDYISSWHSAGPAEGCVIPALSADVSRARPTVKRTYERKISAFADRIASLLDGEQSDRERLAWSVVAMMVGAIAISRGMPEGSESRMAAIDSARDTAKMLIEAAMRDAEAR
jgi:TetR/AcrR family transcriptional regulator, transcriptional repressor for nem operon